MHEDSSLVSASAGERSTVLVGLPVCGCLLARVKGSIRKESLNPKLNFCCFIVNNVSKAYTNTFFFLSNINHKNSHPLFLFRRLYLSVVSLLVTATPVFPSNILPSHTCSFLNGIFCRNFSQKLCVRVDKY